MSEKEVTSHMAGGVGGGGVQATGAAWGNVSRLGYVCPLGGALMTSGAVHSH